MITLKPGRQLTLPFLDQHPPARPASVQCRVNTDDLPDRPLRRIGAGPFRKPHPQAVMEVLLEGGVVGFRGGDVGFEQHPAVDGQPASVEGLDLVRDRDVGVQIRVTRPAVPMGKRGGDEASDVDLADALRSGPGEQGMLLDECQSVLDGGLVGPFDHSRHRRISDRP